MTIDLGKITENARRAVAICARCGVEVIGVTKSVCGRPSVARAMLAGGIRALADSRLDNIAGMRDSGIEAPITLIRSPALSETARCVALADVSLNASVEALRALSADAARARKRHGVIVMVDIDTGREGFAPEAVPGVCREVSEMPWLDPVGLGVYFAHAPQADETMTKQRELVDLARSVRQECGIELPVISGGSSYAFCGVTMAGERVEGVNQLRIGMTILQGIARSKGPELVEGFHHDTFILSAELIEVKQRDRLLGILAIGKIDTDPDQLYPVRPEVRVVRATSDHTVVDLTDVQPAPQVGDRVSFGLGYFALSRLMLSPCVSVSETPD